jgi:hypothetical protein
LFLKYTLRTKCNEKSHERKEEDYDDLCNLPQGKTIEKPSLILVFLFPFTELNQLYCSLLLVQERRGDCRGRTREGIMKS